MTTTVWLELEIAVEYVTLPGERPSRDCPGADAENEIVSLTLFAGKPHAINLPFGALSRPDQDRIQHDVDARQQSHE